MTESRETDQETRRDRQKSGGMLDARAWPLNELAITVIRLSDSFEHFWSELAVDVGVECLFADSLLSIDPSSVGVLLGAGGLERDLIQWLGSNYFDPNIPIFAVGADADRRMTAQILKAGATDYFVLPEDVELLRNVLTSAAENRRKHRQALPSEGVKSEAFHEIIGESVALKQALRRVEKILPHSKTTVLITGETGTGKELLARALHNGGSRRDRPFVALNCSALPGELIESELFGHERGAFTDAHAAKQGMFEVADGGTLFLDELGTLSLNAQAKLLRILEDGIVRRVGGTKERSVDVRVIAATNEDLTVAVREGRLRGDLYYRLGVITLSLPPLRERGNDVVVIAKAFLDRLASEYDVAVPVLTQETQTALKRYPWPGNVRELKNAIERSLLLSEAGTLQIDELLPQGSQVTPATPIAIPFPARLDRITRAAVRATLSLCNDNITEAAKQLGISRPRLRRILNDKKQGVNTERSVPNALDTTFTSHM